MDANWRILVEDISPLKNATPITRLALDSR